MRRTLFHRALAAGLALIYASVASAQGLRISPGASGTGAGANNMIFEQPSLYQSPDNGGHWSQTPPSTAMAGDGYIFVDPVPPGDLPPEDFSMERPSMPGVDSGKWPVGSGIQFDIQGGRRLNQMLKEREMERAYEESLNRAAQTFAELFQRQPMRARELMQREYFHYIPKTSIYGEARRSQSFERSGEALILRGYEDRGHVMQTMRSLGRNVSTGSREAEGAFLDIYHRFQAQEFGYQQRVLREGRISTRRLGDRAVRSTRQVEVANDGLVTVGRNLPESASVSQPRPPPAEMRPELQDLRERLITATDPSPQAQTARSIGLESVDASASAYGQGDNEGGKFYYDVAIAMADIAMGLIPGVGEGKDLYEFLSGRSLLTDEKLSTEARALALLGLATVGLAPQIAKVGRLAGRIMRESEVLGGLVTKATAVRSLLGRAVGPVVESEAVQVLQRAVGRTGRSAEALLNDLNEGILERASGLGIRLEKRSIHFADDLNAAQLARDTEREISYRPDSLVLRGITQDSSSGLVRVFSSESGNVERSWVVHESTIMRNGKLMRPEEIRDLLNLPEVPDSIIDVKLPIGTRIEISEVALNGWGRREGALQIKIRGPVKSEFFNRSSIRRIH